MPHVKRVGEQNLKDSKYIEKPKNNDLYTARTYSGNREIKKDKSKKGEIVTGRKSTGSDICKKTVQACHCLRNTE